MEAARAPVRECAARVRRECSIVNEEGANLASVKAIRDNRARANRTLDRHHGAVVGDGAVVAPPSPALISRTMSVSFGSNRRFISTSAARYRSYASSVPILKYVLMLLT